MYNPSIAKFLSVDPLSPDYPWNSPYSYAEGGPIANIDLDGLERALVINRYNNNGMLQTTTIQVVTNNNVLQNLNAQGNNIGPLTLNDILVINQGNLPPDVLPFDTKTQFSDDEAEIIAGGVDIITTLVARQANGAGRPTNNSDELGDVAGGTQGAGFSFPGSKPQGAINGLSLQSIGTYGEITQTKTTTGPETTIQAIPPTNFSDKILPIITNTGVDGGFNRETMSSLTEAEFNNNLINSISDQIANGANITGINITRAVENAVPAASLRSWFNNSFVPQASTSLNLPTNIFNINTPTGKDLDGTFRLNLTGTIPVTRNITQTSTTTTWGLIQN